MSIHFPYIGYATFPRSEQDQCHCCRREFLFEDLHGYTLTNGAVDLCDDCKFYVVIARQNNRSTGASLYDVIHASKSDGVTIY